jgi:hypothetical protein
MFGIGVVLLARSPFRMSLPERLFRLVWLGPIGRGFVRLAGSGVARSAAAAEVTPVRPVVPRFTARQPSAKIDHGVPADRVANLESRVAALEKWRSGADRV